VKCGQSPVQEAIDAICTAYMNNNNQPLCVIIVGHGGPGIQAIGRGQSATDGEYLGPGGKTDAFVNAVKGKISQLCFNGCEVGKGQAGEDFLQDIADRISTAGVKAKVGGFRRVTSYFRGGLFSLYAMKCWVVGDENCSTTKTEKMGN
jgi:hypothetical protein